MRRTSLATVAVTALAVVVTGCALIPGFNRPKGSIEGLQRVAVVPFAFRDERGVRLCDLCPDDVTMQPTSEEDALLATAFIHEQLTRYPRFITLDPRRLDRLMTVSMSDAVELFRTLEDADAVLVGALVELREREGTPWAPTRPAGATIYAALLDARTGRVLWSETFDGDQKAPGRFRDTFDRVVEGQRTRWVPARVFMRQGARSLIKSMVERVASS